MSFIHTITLPDPHTFEAALAKLAAGTCIGIKPGNNCNFLVRYRPKWQYADGPGRFLCWYNHREESPDTQVRVDQFLGEWFLVVIDHRDLPNGDNGMVDLKKAD